MLVDIVSKNGNLMLNVPLPGSGAPDDDAVSFVADFGRWMRTNGAAIHGSRPWAVYGEGPSTRGQAPLREQGFNEGRNRPYTAEDVRYVQKGGRVYAFAMAWPEGGRLTLRSLAAGSPHAPGTVERVELLGAAAPLAHTRDADGLQVTLPERRSGQYVFTFEISGQGIARG
jgi:alpha-L-fucosidase